jgi:hypothetical protein
VTSRELNVNLNISVIVPFTANDVYWKDLLQDLKVFGANSEILLVGPDAPNEHILAKAKEGVIAPVRYVHSEKGRAQQLNAGARAATHEYFWFLHADTKVPRPAVYHLQNELRQKPYELHFFKLQFLDDGPRWVRLNALAANARTKYFNMPFGDQGFAMHRSVFYKVGGFSNQVRYGEDHVFVWEARRKNISLNLLNATLFTSARAYEERGWVRLTSRRIYLTYKQAFSESLKLYTQRLSRS